MGKMFDKYGDVFSKNSKWKKSIAVDLDGTLAQYKVGEFDPVVIGEPIPGAKEAMTGLKRLGYIIIVWTTRCNAEVMGETLLTLVCRVSNWLDKHQIAYDEIYVGQGKPLVYAFVDDRSVHFRGSWELALAELKIL